MIQGQWVQESRQMKTGDTLFSFLSRCVNQTWACVLYGLEEEKPAKNARSIQEYMVEHVNSHSIYHQKGIFFSTFFPFI